MKKFASLFLLSAISASFAVAQTADASKPSAITPEQKASIESNIKKVLNSVAFVPGANFSTWDDNVKSVRDRLDSAQSAIQVASAFNDALQKFGYSHLVVMTPEQSRARVTGTRVGLGVQIETKPDGIHIKGVIQDSPAFKAGLVAGDIILTIDGKPANADSKLAGEKGTTAVLTVKSVDGKEREVKVIRDSFNTNPPAQLHLERNGEVAVLKIPTFDRGYSGDKIIGLLDQTKDAKLLVVDLRNNPGGFVYNLLHLTGLLLPNQPNIGTMINRSMAEKFTKETGLQSSDLSALVKWNKDGFKPMAMSRAFYPKRMVVLTNGGTGSAAEITAAALRDVGGAKVFGSNSAGMVLAAIVQQLGDGFSMMVPIQDYVTINGLRLEGNGVIPDFPVTDAPTITLDAKDPVIQKVLGWYDTAPTK